MALKHSRAKLPRESSREGSLGRGRDPGRPLRRPGPGGGARRGGAAAGEPPPRLSPAARGPALRRGPRPEPPGVAPVAQPARGPPLVPAFPAPARLGSARRGSAPALAPWPPTASTSPCAIPPSPAPPRPPPARCSACSTSGGRPRSTGERGGEGGEERGGGGPGGTGTEPEPGTEPGSASAWRPERAGGGAELSLRRGRVAVGQADSPHPQPAAASRSAEGVAQGLCAPASPAQAPQRARGCAPGSILWWFRCVWGCSSLIACRRPAV